MKKTVATARIDRTARYAAVMGKFGESLVSHWLSRSGFEVAIVDQVGLDIIAYHPRWRRRLGITVKARTRLPTNPTESVYLFRSRRECTYFTRTCAAFNSEPWVAVYFEREGDAELYLTSLENYERKYWARGVPIGSWKMTPNARAAYAGDAAVRHIALDFKTEHWNFDGNGVLVDGKVANARREKT